MDRLGASRVAAEHAAESEAARTLAAPVVTALRDAGLLRMAAPDVGVPPGESLRCAEAIARADGSAGWCVSIHVTSSLLAGYVLDAPKAIASGVWAPRGTAVPVDGGVRVTGRWAYCSGISHADILYAGCLPEGGGPPIVAAIPTADLEVLDTWHTTGLRGTGSHDAVADDVFVPSERIASLLTGPAIDAPLYRFPPFGFFAASIAAAALGIARGAMDDFLALAPGKAALGSSRSLAARPGTWAAVAEAEASLRAARAFFYEAIDACWSAALAGAVGVDDRRDLRLAATHAARASAGVVTTLHDLAGGAAIYAGSSLERRFRDAHTATAHFQVNAATWELTGRLLLGVDTDVSGL